LKEPVEILRDRWGIAHVYAKSEHDLFFAQGYNAASDRLFQLELWRRRALGTCAEILGRRELKADTASRLFKFRGDLGAELSHYHPRGESIVMAFVEGVNARVAETEKDPRLLPLEFRLLGLQPGRWTPEVVISRHQGLLANAAQELNNGRAVGRVGAEKVKELSWFRPGNPVLALDPAIDVGLLDENLLELYEAFKGTIRFTSADPAATARNAGDAPGDLATTSAAESTLWRLGIDIGSNNWTVSAVARCRVSRSWRMTRIARLPCLPCATGSTWRHPGGM
jgi:penicillin amidase